jgi:uncharacterized protein (DUF2147 family)|tara:strand:+ start:1081 stop:1506 length:426 start_codon:yes stop_codon:yes gene_type:complete
MTTTNINYSARTGFSMRMIKSALFIFTLLSSSLALSADISGTWKHSKKPIWIEIRLTQGDGKVVRNDKFPERVGNTFVKDLKADKSKQGIWHGIAYIRKLEDYKNVEISLSDTGEMQVTGKVGFLSRTVEWVRTDKISSTE